ncbi:hypothetical protein ES705_44895 [subsurface metagenome]
MFLATATIPGYMFQVTVALGLFYFTFLSDAFGNNFIFYL